MRRLAILLIDVYQRTLSPDHGFVRHMFPGGYCKYTPTCSDYTKEAIRKYGVLKGGVKGVGRILRCNPCSKGGKDLP